MVCLTTDIIYLHFLLLNEYLRICLRVYMIKLIHFVCSERLKEACKLKNTSPGDIDVTRV